MLLRQPATTLIVITPITPTEFDTVLSESWYLIDIKLNKLTFSDSARLSLFYILNGGEKCGFPLNKSSPSTIWADMSIYTVPTSIPISTTALMYIPLHYVRTSPSLPMQVIVYIFRDWTCVNIFKEERLKGKQMKLEYLCKTLLITKRV